MSEVKFDDRIQVLLSGLTHCKLDYAREKEACKKIRENNAKLEVELKEARELEKSHRYQLTNSREMIENLQETVSELVYLKRDMKKLKEDLASKDTLISVIEKEKDDLLTKSKSNTEELRNSYDRYITELTEIHDKKVRQVQHDAETQVAQFTCVIGELRANIADMEAQHRDKMNVVVLEYEEKLQRSAARLTQLQDQQAGLVARTGANVDAYRRRLEELEEKLKQSQFKEYLAQSTTPSTHYGTQQVERPYSVERDYCNSDIETALDSKLNPTPSHQKSFKPNTLQVTYYDSKAPTPKQEKKGAFNITKKRKLYNDKAFQDF